MHIKAQTIRYCKFLDRKGPTFNLAFGVLCTALLGFVDFFSDRLLGTDYSLSLFYLLPVAFVSWFAGKNTAIGISLLCLATTLASRYQTQETLSLLLWKNGSAFAFFLVVGLLLAKLRNLLDHERIQSRVDNLTGVLNRRGFLDATTKEVFRLRRFATPFTLVYIDLDNFKEVNDTQGHAQGDFLLQTVASTIARNLRRTDTVARLGGDEFAILLASTDEYSARVAIQKIRKQLQEKMSRHSLAVTFSFGVLTCNEPPTSEEEVIALADKQMYEVKRSGKNGISHALYGHLDKTGQ